MSFQERLDKLITISGLSYKEIANKTCIKAGNVSHYRTGKVKPSFNAIIDLANLFNVSTDYLLLGKESDINSKTVPNLSHDESLWLNLYQQTPKESRSYLLSMAQAFLQTLPKQNKASLKNQLISANTDEDAATIRNETSNIA